MPAACLVEMPKKLNPPSSVSITCQCCQGLLGTCEAARRLTDDGDDPPKVASPFEVSSDAALDVTIRSVGERSNLHFCSST
jgi:hypothetical protein